MAENSDNLRVVPAGNPPQSTDEKRPTAGSGQDESEVTDAELSEGDVGYTFFEMLETLPGRVQTYLLSDDIGQARVEIYDSFKLSSEDRDVALFVELEVFFGDVNLEEYPDELWSSLPWEDSEKKRAQELVRETVGRIFLPARSFLGDVAGLLEVVGGDIEKYPSKTIESQLVTYEQATGDFMSDIKTDDLDEAGQRRLSGIIESMLRGVRNKDDAVNMLMRPKKTGGLEMNLDRADRIMSAVRDGMNMVKYVDELPEDPKDKPGERSGRAEETKEEAASQSEYSPEEIRWRLAGTPEERQALSAAAQGIEKATGQDSQLFKEKLHEVVYSSSGTDRWEAAALLLLAARNGLLLDLLSGDTRFSRAVKFYMREKGRQSQYLSAVRMNPAGPQAVNAFLQLVLCGLAGMSTEDSARYGLRVTNLLKKSQPELAGLVAFDLDRGEFVWTDFLQ